MVEIIAVVIGTVVGWFLRNLSGKGKIEIYVNKFELINLSYDEANSQIKKIISLDNALMWKNKKIDIVALSVDIYNTSQQESRVLRDIRLKYFDEKERVGEKNRIDNFSITLGPGQMKTYELVCFPSHFEFIPNNEFMLLYKDYRSKENSFSIQMR